MLVSKVIKWYNSKRFIIPHTGNHCYIFKGLYILMMLLRICNVLYNLSLCCNHNKLVHGTLQKLWTMSSTKLWSHCHYFSIPKDKDQEGLGLWLMTEPSSNLLVAMLFLSAAWGHLMLVVYLQVASLFLQRNLFYIFLPLMLYWCDCIAVPQIFLLMLSDWLYLPIFWQ